MDLADRRIVAFAGIGRPDKFFQSLKAQGANRSLIHIDWMIGSNQIDIDGLTADGKAEPVMRKGEWV